MKTELASTHANGLTLPHHCIPYLLYQHPIATQKAGAPTYAARVLTKEICGLKTIAARMAKEGCPLTPATIELVIRQFADTAADLLAEGKTVNIPGFLNLKTAIRGTFPAPDAPFAPPRNTIRVNATAGRNLKHAATTSPPLRLPH